MKEIDGEKKKEWKKDVTQDRIVVSEADVSKSITSLSSLPLHYSNESILKNFGNSIIHNGENSLESIIIDKALFHVCFPSLFVILFVLVIYCRVFIECVLFHYCSIIDLFGPLYYSVL